jgi:tetratricopeptide (TPR) repeat protein
MPRTLRAALPLLVVWLLLPVAGAPGLWSAALRAQAASEGLGNDPPARHVPVRVSSRQELDRCEALALYGLAAVQEHKNRLVEAMHTLEAARRLDPDATPPLKSLVPIYLALDRIDDALATCRRVLELDPDDCDTGYLYARQLRGHGATREARAVLERMAGRPTLKDHLDVKAQVFFDLGVLYEAAGEWAAAEKSFRSVAEVLDKPAAMLEQGAFNREEIETQAAETWERLGHVCLKAGHIEQAVAAFEKAQKHDALRAPRLAYNLAEVLEAAGRPEEALQRVAEYLRTQPQGTDGYELKIKLQRRLGREADVLPDLETASGRDPNNGGLRLLLAREYVRAGRHRDAEAACDRLLEQGQAPEVYRVLFDTYKADPRQGAEKVLTRLNDALTPAGDDKKAEPGQPARARAMLQVLRGDAELVRQVLAAAKRRLMAHGPRVRGNRAAAGNGLAYATRAVLAALAARTHQLDFAEEMYRSCLSSEVGPGFNEQEVYHGLLMVLRQAHKHEAIVELCERGLEQAQVTNRVLFHLYLAESQLALGRDKAALAAVNAAVDEASEKERLDCRLERAEVLSQSGRHEQAASECRALLKEYNRPGDVRRIRSVLSAIYSAAHDLPRAEEQLQQVLQDDPNDATANNDLGYLWADQGKNLEEAERLVRKALELDREQRQGGAPAGADAEGDNAAFVDSLGWVLFRRGQWEGARRELERAAGMDGGSDDPVVWDHLGDVLHRLGRKDEAAAAWKKALTLYEAGSRRRGDGRYDEIERKLRLLEP